MAGRGPVAERLRNEVRRYVRKDGDRYAWGNGQRLAEAIGKPPSWITTYTDATPTSHADVDTAIAICAFLALDFATLSPLRAAPPPMDPLVAGMVEALEVMKTRSQQRLAVNWIRATVNLPPLLPKVESSPATIPGGRTKRARGRRR